MEERDGPGRGKKRDAREEVQRGGRERASGRETERGRKESGGEVERGKTRLRPCLRFRSPIGRQHAFQIITLHGSCHGAILGLQRHAVTHPTQRTSFTLKAQEASSPERSLHCDQQQGTGSAVKHRAALEPSRTHRHSTTAAFTAGLTSPRANVQFGWLARSSLLVDFVLSF